MTFQSAALAIDEGTRALICFPRSDSPDISESRNCEIFDTVISVPTHRSQYNHAGGGLGLYVGQPTTVGDVTGGELIGNVKVEIYYSSKGWASLSDFPM